MQKKLIALAVAGLASTGAFAQSNVTLYGVADAYIGSFTASGADRAAAVNSGGLATSRLGFKGVEDLGNGLKALFTLEYRLDIDQNTTVGGNTTNGGSSVSGPARQQFIGLTGGFGTAVVGRLQTAGYDWHQKFDALGGTAIDSLNVAQGAAGSILSSGSASANSAARASNAVAYISPSFAGLTVAVNHALLDENGVNQTANLASATYENGPLAVGVAYANTNVVANGGAKDVGLGASYDFGVAKVQGTFQRFKADAATDANKAYSLTGVVPVTAAGSVLASYAKAKVQTTAASDDVKSYTVAYLHALSKRTTAYAGYVRASGDTAASVSLGGLTSTAGGSASGLVAGLNHKF